MPHAARAASEPRPSRGRAVSEVSEEANYEESVPLNAAGIGKFLTRAKGLQEPSELAQIPFWICTRIVQNQKTPQFSQFSSNCMQTALSFL